MFLKTGIEHLHRAQPPAATWRPSSRAEIQMRGLALWKLWCGAFLQEKCINSRNRGSKT